jgi:hypothetical protein
MIHLSLAMLIALVSFAGGAAAVLIISRLKSPAAASTAAPATRGANAPISGSAELPAEQSLELHLIFNVLNRVVMALHADERIQDGVAEMAAYLRAWHELQRKPGQTALVQQLSAYWRLSRWLHGQSSDALHIEAHTPDLSSRTLNQIACDLTQVMRDLEGCPKADSSIRLGVETSPSGQRLVTAHVAVSGPAQSAHPALVDLTRGWKSDGRQLNVRLEWPAVG